MVAAGAADRGGVTPVDLALQMARSESRRHAVCERARSRSPEPNDYGDGNGLRRSESSRLAGIESSSDTVLPYKMFCKIDKVGG